MLFDLTQAQATVAAGLLGAAGAIGSAVVGALMTRNKRQSERELETVRDKVIQVEGRLPEENQQTESGLSNDSLAAAGSVQTDLAVKLRELWDPIRDRLDHIAKDPSLGRAALEKYFQIDRRNYLNLANILNLDDRLGSQGHLYVEAADIWRRNRSNRRPPPEEAVQRLEAIKKDYFWKGCAQNLRSWLSARHPNT